MLRAFVALATLLAFTGASAASTSAKDWYLLHVCGASRCVTYHNNAAVKVLRHGAVPSAQEALPRQPHTSRSEAVRQSIE